MTASGVIDRFSLLGGPLHRLGRRLGLVRQGSNTLLLGVALGVIPWFIGVLLVWAGGTISTLFSLNVIGAHVRLLVGIPLLFVCETVLDPRIRQFVSYAVRAGLIPAQAMANFEAQLGRTMRWNNASLPEALCLAAAIVLGAIPPHFLWGAAASAVDQQQAASLAGWWNGIVCLTLWRFLALRWAWRLGLWYRLLWRFSRLDLHLMPAHADCAGGLGNLREVHGAFFTLILALSAVLSASFAEDIARGVTAFDTIYAAFGLILVVDVVLFLSPLVLFTPRMRSCRRQGLLTYMELAARYATEFDQKWLGKQQLTDESLLGTPDVQSLADLANGVAIVQRMSAAPISRSLLISYGVAAILPMLPLVLLRYPLAELAAQIIKRLTGL